MAIVENGRVGQSAIFPFLERAAGALVRSAPITQQDRWEENAGYSPSTLAAVIGGLICAAEISRYFEADELATFLEEFADWIEGHLEDWTVTNNGVLDAEIKRHYMRIRPPECGEAYAQEDCGKEVIRLSNRPPGERVEFEAREIIDAGFLELVRYGVRRADDPLIVDSLKVVDAVLKRDLPQGPGWLRYNGDGYGQRPDGGPYQGWGQGRVWPLLTGERAHYEMAAGKDIGTLIETYEKFATSGQLLPEQVWDEADRPERRLRAGAAGGVGGAVGLGACRVSETDALGRGWESLRPHRHRVRSGIASRRDASDAGRTWKSTAFSGRFSTSRPETHCAFWMRAVLRWCGRTTAGRR